MNNTHFKYYILYITFQNDSTRHYFELNIVLDVVDVNIWKLGEMPDRKFINSLLEKVFDKNELQISSAKGNQSRGKAHKPLDSKRLNFIRGK